MRVFLSSRWTHLCAAARTGPSRCFMLSIDYMKQLVADFCDGRLAHEILRDRRPHCVVARLKPMGSDTVILKLWNKPGPQGALRRLSRTDPLTKEIRALGLFQESHVRVPKVYGYCQLSDRSLPGTGALFLQDLCRCVIALDHLKGLIRAGDEDAVAAFEEEIIDVTRKILDARLVDPDHSLINLVVDSSQTLYRLDYEVARKVLSPALAVSSYGDMLGRLLVTYTFAVQPDVARTRDFAQRLVAALRPPWLVLNRAARFVTTQMQIQRNVKGIDTRVDLPWIGHCDE